MPASYLQETVQFPMMPPTKQLHVPPQLPGMVAPTGPHCGAPASSRHPPVQCPRTPPSRHMQLATQGFVLAMTISPTWKATPLTRQPPDSSMATSVAPQPVSADD